MAGARDHLEEHEARAGSPAIARAPQSAVGPTIAGREDPRLANAAGGAADLLHLQRTVGNAAVRSLVAPSVQRAVQIDELTTRVDVGDAPAGGAGAAAPSPAAGGPVTSDGTGTTISGPTITLDAARTTANGVLHADVIEADSIIASSYSPGAGNVW